MIAITSTMIYFYSQNTSDTKHVIVFPTPTNSPTLCLTTQAWHYCSRVSIDPTGWGLGSHRLRAWSHRTNPTSDTNRKFWLPVLLINQLINRASEPSGLLIFSDFRKAVYLLWLVYHKSCNWGAAKWQRCKGEVCSRQNRVPVLPWVPHPLSTGCVH